MRFDHNTAGEGATVPGAAAGPRGLRGDRHRWADDGEPHLQPLRLGPTEHLITMALRGRVRQKTAEKDATTPPPFSPSQHSFQAVQGPFLRVKCFPKQYPQFAQ